MGWKGRDVSLAGNAFELREQRVERGGGRVH